MDSFGGIISIFCDLGHPVFVVFDAWDHATIKQSILAAENAYSMAIYGQTRIVYSAVLKIGPWTWDTWGTSLRERRGAQANHDRIRCTLVLGIFDLFWFCACGKPRLQLRSQVGANSNQSGENIWNWTLGIGHKLYTTPQSFDLEANLSSCSDF